MALAKENQWNKIKFSIESYIWDLLWNKGGIEKS